MQLPMSFLEPKPLSKTVEPVRPVLDLANRDELVTVLARLIANAVLRTGVAADEEVHDE